MKIKIRPNVIRWPRCVSYDSWGKNEALEILMEMGFNIYEHPAQEDLCIVSPKRLTYRDVRNQCVRYNIDAKWWDKKTDLNDRLHEELDCVNL